MVDNQMTRLTEKVANRTVCVLLHGKSIQDIPKHALTGKDWCYASINNFIVVEDLMLKPINAELSVVLITSEAEIIHKTMDIGVFLDRSPSNVFITTTWALGALENRSHAFVDRFRNQIILVPRLPFMPILKGRRQARPNSVTLLFLALAEAGVKKIVVLGMDGCSIELSNIDEKRTYIDNGRFDYPDRQTEIKVDTITFNQHFLKLWSNKTCTILNCSPGSHINAVKQITHDHLVKMS